MQQELFALENNNTWDLTYLPQGKKAIGSKRVYKIKRNADGSIDRFKEILVARVTIKLRARITIKASPQLQN